MKQSLFEGKQAVEKLLGPSIVAKLLKLYDLYEYVQITASGSGVNSIVNRSTAEVTAMVTATVNEDSKFNNANGILITSVSESKLHQVFYGVNTAGKDISGFRTSNDLGVTWTVFRDLGFTLEFGEQLNLDSEGNVTLDLNDATLEQKGVVQLEESVSSTSTSKAATSSSVKAAYDKGDESLEAANASQQTANEAQEAATSAQQTANEALVAGTGSGQGRSNAQNDLRFLREVTEIEAEKITSGTVPEARLAVASKVLKGITQLSDSVVSDSSTLAATPLAVKTAFDKGVVALEAANTAQETADATAAAGLVVNFVASGTLPDGKPVILKSDGTVTVVFSGNSGNTSVFHQGQTGLTKSVYDSVNNKIIVAYRDNSNAQSGTALVGTVTGTSISFGDPVVFNPVNTSEISMAFHEANNKIIIVYSNAGNSDKGTAVVGTVVGEAISFDFPVVFENSVTSDIAVIYDPTSTKLVISYRCSASSWVGETIIGTVSGNTISFGTAVVFDSNSASNMASTYDPVNDKVVIAYESSNIGRVVVGTVSGTSISFTTPVIFNNAATGEISIVYDVTNSKIVVVYDDAGGTGFCTAIVGTVNASTPVTFGTAVAFTSGGAYYMESAYDTANSEVVIAFMDIAGGYIGSVIRGTVAGDSISFGASSAFDGGSPSFISVLYDPISNKALITYQDFGNEGSGTAILTFNNEATNLTTSNFVGITVGTYSDSEVAAVVVQGGIVNNQVGLVINATYYVQEDGTIATTADTPNVNLGKALSATTLLLKGL